MTKYYFALDNKSIRNNPSNTRRFTIIDLNKVTNFRHKKENDSSFYSIRRINDFTTMFVNEEQLKAFLINNGLIEPTDLNKPLTICYQKNGTNFWLKCGREGHIKDETFKQSDVLFKGEKELFDIHSLARSIYSHSQSFSSIKRIDYHNFSFEQCLDFQILLDLEYELKSRYYEHNKNICEDVTRFHRYLSDIQSFGLITQNFYEITRKLVEHLAYRYDRFDSNLEYPLVDKNQKRYVNTRQLYEFLITYVQFYRYYHNKLNKYLLAQAEERQKKESNTENDLYEQITLNDWLKKR